MSQRRPAVVAQGRKHRRGIHKVRQLRRYRQTGTGCITRPVADQIESGGTQCSALKEYLGERDVGRVSCHDCICQRERVGRLKNAAAATGTISGDDYIPESGGYTGTNTATDTYT